MLHLHINDQYLGSYYPSTSISKIKYDYWQQQLNILTGSSASLLTPTLISAYQHLHIYHNGTQLLQNDATPLAFLCPKLDHSNPTQLYLRIEEPGCKGGASTPHPQILAYFIFLTILFIVFFLFGGLLPIFSKIVAYTTHYLVDLVTKLPYVTSIIAPFTVEFEKCTLPLLFKLPIILCKFIWESLTGILSIGIMYFLLSGFLVCALLVPIYWIHKSSLKDAFNRSNKVATIIVLIYICLYLFVNSPLLLRSTCLFLSTQLAPHSSFLQTIFSSLANVFNFSLYRLFTWIPTISMMEMTNRMIDLTTAQLGSFDEYMRLLLMLDFNNDIPTHTDEDTPQSGELPSFHVEYSAEGRTALQVTPTICNIVISNNATPATITRMLSQVLGYYKIERIPIGSIAKILGELYLQNTELRQIAAQAGADTQIGYVIAGYLGSRDEELRKEILNSITTTGQPPSAATLELFKTMLQLFIMCVKPFYILRNEIAPAGELFNANISGGIAGFFTAIAYIIAAPIVAIIG